MARIRRPFPLVTRSTARIAVRRENTVLLVQDMQGFLVELNMGISALASDRGVFTEFDEYFTQAKDAEANIRSLQEHFSTLGIPSCYTLWGTERPMLKSPLQSALDIVPEFGAPSAKIVSSLSPSSELDVFTKGGLSAFSSPEFVSSLRERRIENIILSGVITEFGIQATAFQAMDLGYRIIIVSDCCASMTYATNETTLDSLSFGVTKVRPWRELCYNLEMLKFDDVALL